MKFYITSIIWLTQLRSTVTGFSMERGFSIHDSSVTILKITDLPDDGICRYIVSKANTGG